VRDTAAALDVSAGGEPGDPFVVPKPAEPYAKLMRRDPGRLRIGFTAASPIGTEVHPEAVVAVSEATKLLGSLGLKKPRPKSMALRWRRLSCMSISDRYLPWWRRHAPPGHALRISSS
jgi:Asp-tRNA(Asn)/Glu-tRNA(Gln) amidotransferase A subunit family amidase